MRFEESKTVEKIAQKLGYILGYFIFTTILFFILTLLHKIPETWSHLHVMGITLIILIVGAILKRLLK